MRRINARCFLINKEGKILLMRHSEGDRRALPGGGIEEKETIYESLIREIKEEYNYNIEIIGSKLGIIDDIMTELPLPIFVSNVDYISPQYGETHLHEYIFLAKVIGGEERIQKEEIFKYKWFEIDEIMQLDTNNDTHRRILEVLAKIRDKIKGG